MGRKFRVIKRPQVLPDPVYKSVLVSRFINRMMIDGKKRVAEKLFYDSLEIIKERTGEDGFKVFQEAIEAVLPQVEVRSRRVGGANYQIPVEVREERKYTLSIRWLVSNCRKRKERGMEQKLAAEFMEAQKESGSAYKKKQEVHKMAEANKAFAHLRW
jgi:small subunit ribosomal protein S7